MWRDHANYSHKDYGIFFFFNGKEYGIFGDYTTLLFAPFINDNFVNNYNKKKANVQCKR